MPKTVTIPEPAEAGRQKKIPGKGSNNPALPLVVPVITLPLLPLVVVIPLPLPLVADVITLLKL